MTEGRCGTCKHWEQFDVGWRIDLSLTLIEGETEATKYAVGSPYQERVRLAEQSYGKCSLISLLHGYEDVDESELPLAFTKDGSDYQAYLHTREEFGCVLQEPVEEVMNDGG